MLKQREIDLIKQKVKSGYPRKVITALCEVVTIAEIDLCMMTGLPKSKLRPAVDRLRNTHGIVIAETPGDKKVYTLEDAGSKIKTECRKKRNAAFPKPTKSEKLLMKVFR